MIKLFKAILKFIFANKREQNELEVQEIAEGELLISNWQGKKFRIVYTSGQDVETTRVIEPKRIEGQYMVAFCHLRNSFRTFRVDRIVGVVDNDTGEIYRVNFS
jgi:predicted DNA-binding transcriptional regulator YafY